MTARRPGSTAAIAVGSVLLGLIGSVVVLLLVLGGGDDKPVCDRVAGIAVTDLGISAQRFETAYKGIRRTRDLTEEATSAPPEQRQDLLTSGFTTFYRMAHDLTHDFDIALCEQDYDLATDLRERVVELEIALGAQNNPDEILAGLDEVERLLERAEPLVL